MFVRDVMTTDPLSVSSATTIREALRLLDTHKLTSVPVVDGHRRVRGILSEADLLREVLSSDPWVEESSHEGAPQDRATYVGEVMTNHPVTVAPETELATAVDLLTTSVIKSVPVVDEDDRLVGILSRSDIVHMLATADAELERQVADVLRDAGLRDWCVEVHEGSVELTGPQHVREAHVARLLAGTVRGVTHVRTG